MILCPYTPSRLLPATREWVEAHNGLLVDVSGSDEGYWDCLDRKWNLYQEDLFVIEHDIVPGYGGYDTMLGCPHSWCTSPYMVGGKLRLAQGLGFVKFSVLLQECIPDLMAQVERVNFTNDEPRMWHTMDWKIAHLLLKHQFKPHEHGMSTHQH